MNSSQCSFCGVIPLEGGARLGERGLPIATDSVPLPALPFRPPDGALSEENPPARRSPSSAASADLRERDSVSRDAACETFARRPRPHRLLADHAGPFTCVRTAALSHCTAPPTLRCLPCSILPRASPPQFLPRRPSHISLAVRRRPHPYCTPRAAPPPHPCRPRPPLHFRLARTGPEGHVAPPLHPAAVALPSTLDREAPHPTQSCTRGHSPHPLTLCHERTTHSPYTPARRPASLQSCRGALPLTSLPRRLPLTLAAAALHLKPCRGPPSHPCRRPAPSPHPITHLLVLRLPSSPLPRYATPHSSSYLAAAPITTSNSPASSGKDHLHHHNYLRRYRRRHLPYFTPLQLAPLLHTTIAAAPHPPPSCRVAYPSPLHNPAAAPSPHPARGALPFKNPCPAPPLPNSTPARQRPPLQLTARAPFPSKPCSRQARHSPSPPPSHGGPYPLLTHYLHS
ncbi:hypothetical protein C7M84_003574 [Penaeus vannamei]|uniref:Uncharacterized protein n=1 Tax=Penaeus vannamei TaxID=6689 RepID=A0A3R7QTJ4_PENVA|nr:hypothetical protein C7M84_003574 [Penaeus vannamei]